MMHMGEPVTLDDVDQVIRKVDRDGDGAIDYNEFTKVTPHTPSKSHLPPQRVLGAPSCAGVAPVRRRDVADVIVSCGCARLTGHHGRVRFFEDNVRAISLRSDLVARILRHCGGVCRGHGCVRSCTTTHGTRPPRPRLLVLIRSPAKTAHSGAHIHLRSARPLRHGP